MPTELSDEELALLEQSLNEAVGHLSEPGDPDTADPGVVDEDSKHRVDADQLISALPSPDALAPWGDLELPTASGWSPDILGEDYQARLIPLEPDEEGEVVATLVRRNVKGFRNRRNRKFALLFLHGRNDYFFHEEAAGAFADMGATFYALDLRKYGRSLRPWQTIGFASDLNTYSEEIGQAIHLIKSEFPDLPLVIYGHSTGGLIATLWAWRHPGFASGLILNSAWLELQTMTSMRPALHRVISRLATYRPRQAVVGQSKINTYYRTLAGGWAESGFELPDHLREYTTDPAIVGWTIAKEWKRPFSYPAPAAWMQAVLEGHAQVEHQVHLDCPVLSMTSTTSGSEEDWTPAAFSSDLVLNADIIVERSAKLSDHVEIERYPGKHDLLLSDPDVREQIYGSIARWLRFIEVVR